MRYENINNVYGRNKDKAPAFILNEIADFFVECGKSYLSGEISEKDFYIKTAYADIFEDLLFKYHDTGITFGKRLLDEGFEESWHEWKETRDPHPKPWMTTSFCYSRNMKESIDWLFLVIDTLKVPLDWFYTIWGFYDGECPQIERIIRDDVMELLYVGMPINYGILQSEIYPIGKTFRLLFTNGDVAEITIEKFGDSHYIGNGFVSGYMEKPGKIEIKIINGRVKFVIAKKNISDYWRAIHICSLPILHSNWKEYNHAVYEHLYRIEAAYKILRMPYLMGEVERGSRITIKRDNKGFRLVKG